MDHSECAPATSGQWWAHTHEGEFGWWTFPGETNPYDHSPTGAFSEAKTTSPIKETEQ